MTLPQHLRVRNRTVALAEIKRLYEAFENDNNPIINEKTIIHPDDPAVQGFIVALIIKGEEEEKCEDSIYISSMRVMCFIHHIVDAISSHREDERARRSKLKDDEKVELYKDKHDFMEKYPFHDAMRKGLFWEEAVLYVVEKRKAMGF